MTTRRSAAARRLSDDEIEAIERADNSKQIVGLGQGFYESLDDFLKADLPPAADLLTGIERRDVALLFTDSALLQSNFLLQLGLALAAGVAFSPLLPASSTPRRVLYLNNNWRAARWQQELDPLLKQLTAPQTARENFLPSVDAHHLGSRLNLNDDEHLKHLMLNLKHLRPDVIIIDDLEALFPAAADEPTARAARLLLSSLHNLAQCGDCVLLAGSSSAHFNRRFMATERRLADAVFRLEKPRHSTSLAYLFSCEKSRGVLAKSLWLDWQEEEHRFVESEEQPSTTPKKLPTVEEIFAFVEAQQGARTAEIILHFADRASPRKMAYLLKDAELLGRLKKSGTGYWQCEEERIRSSEFKIQSLRSFMGWESDAGWEEEKKKRGEEERGAVPRTACAVVGGR